MRSITLWKVFGRLLWSAGSDFWIASTFLLVWAKPGVLGQYSVRHFTFVMLIEFLVVHSTGFLGAIAAKDESGKYRLGMFTLLLALYSLFAAAFSAMYGGWWPLAAFLALTLSKFPTVVLQPPDLRGQDALITNWAAMTALYLGGAAFTAIYKIPAWGVTPEVIAAQDFGIGGLWPEEPYRPLAFGAVYFSGLGLVAMANEILGLIIRRKRKKHGS